jgi:hypothetical protein
MKYKFHLLSILLFIEYFFPYFLTGNIFIDPHDNLDGVVVYNKIIAQSYNDSFDKFKIFLGGVLNWYNFDRIFNPLIFVYYIFDFKSAYFIEKLIFKLIGFFSFLSLSKKLNFYKLNQLISSIIYVTFVNFHYTSSIAILALPYILKLVISEKKLKLKNYLILLFIGLNSSLVFDLFSLILLFFIFSIKNISKYFKILITILLGIILVNWQLIFSIISQQVPHRYEFRNSVTTFEALAITIKDFFLLNYYNSFYFLDLIYSVFFLICLILALKSKKKIILKLLYILVFIHILIFIIRLISFKNHNFFILDIFNLVNFERISRIQPLIITLLFAYLLEIKKKFFQYTLIIFSLLIIIISQTKLTFIHLAKVFIYKNFEYQSIEELKILIVKKEYKEFYSNISKYIQEGYKKTYSIYNSSNTFDNYYKFQDYKIIKNIVGEKRVISIGLDPLVAVANDIFVVDGYHNLYPLIYKKKFRKIIKEELEYNSELKNYYDNFGSRVYVFYNNQEKLNINFDEAKNIGANFVISKFIIKDKMLKKMCEKCNNNTKLNLYKIL